MKLHFVLSSLFFLLFFKTSLSQVFTLTYPHVTRLHRDHLHIRIDAFGRNFTLDLRPNYFLTEDYTESPAVRSKSAKQRHCHYKGAVLGFSPSWAAVSYCDAKLSGIFEAEGVVYHLQSDKHTSSNGEVRVFTDPPVPEYHCGFNDLTSPRTSRKRRALHDANPVFRTHRYVELVLVNDNKVYLKYRKDANFIFERSKEIGNILNSLYSVLNITIALVGVVVWTDKDYIHISHNSSETLNNFLRYRRDVLMPKFPNDNAQLITASSFESGIVGKALKQTLCTYEYSGGVNFDYSDSASMIATTIAHELGHNFGMEHDTEQCVCPGHKCIMGPSTTSPSPRHWSSCSIQQISDSLQHGIDHCLFNKPKIIFQPHCGNGIVDQGEQCDCGMPGYCSNSCCNATTCQLVSGAQCSQGECCDLHTCSLITSESNLVCRTSRSPCDIEERCDGLSSECPHDVYRKDGTECIEGFAYCYAGMCQTREDQCKQLWGKQAEVAEYRCYQNNLNGNSSGNCGYDKLKKHFQPCETVKDIICGRLHCTSRGQRLSLEYGPEGSTVISQTIESRKGTVSCFSAMIDLGLQEMDVGLVPNGAKCGKEAMCLEQRCVPVKHFVESKPCPSDCNNNGDCDNEGVCHCFTNYRSHDCGSFARSFYLSLIYVFFFFILPLLSLVFLLYSYRESLTNWFRQKSFLTNDYNNQRRKKNPSSLVISLPLETRQTQSETTFSSTSKPATVIRPIRPAPPIPNGLAVQAAPAKPRVASTKPEVLQQTDLRASLRRNSINRPRRAPPLPPPPQPLARPEDSVTPEEEGSRIKHLINAFEKS